MVRRIEKEHHAFQAPVGALTMRDRADLRLECLKAAVAIGGGREIVMENAEDFASIVLEEPRITG